MKQFLLPIALLCCSFFSTTGALSQTNDPAAKKMLDAVSATYKNYKSLQASFSFTTENNSGKVLNSQSGTVTLRGNQYSMVLGNEQTIFDGTNLYVYDKKANEVTISKPAQSENLLSPQKLLSTAYAKNYLYRSNGTVTFKGKKTTEIEMTPKDKTKSYFKIYLYVLNNRVAGVKIFESNGTRYIFNVENFNPNVAVSDAAFSFNPKTYAGIEVIDLR